MVAQHENSGRPRVMSFGSHKTHKSNGSVGKMDLTESPKEKSARRMTTKANPTMAMTEQQPSVQAQHKSTLDSLRSMQHRDALGNIITDPDRSNPTRPRMERPLDTIRSFEAAIDGSYNKRYSRIEPQDSTFGQSRRSSYYQGTSRANRQPRLQGDGAGYYGNRRSSSRPDSYYDNNSGPGGQAQPNRRLSYATRTQSDPVLYGNNSYTNPYTNGNGNSHVNGNGVYPVNGYQQSNDTVASAAGSGSHGTEQWNNSTNPSSENSSIDRVQPGGKPDQEVYGFSGFGGAPNQLLQGPILEEHGHNAPGYGEPGYGQSKQGSMQGYQGNDLPAPPPPPHAASRGSASRPMHSFGTPSRSYNDAPAYEQRPQQRPDPAEKRKSWLKRRFSKNG